MAEKKQLLNLRKALVLDCSYNEENKKVFERASKSFLRAIAKELHFTEYKISYNKAGIACAGNPILMGMWDYTHGIYININGDKFSFENCLYRTICSPNDYSGGCNQYLDLNIDSFDEIIEKFQKLNVNYAKNN